MPLNHDQSDAPALVASDLIGPTIVVPPSVGAVVMILADLLGAPAMHSNAAAVWTAWWSLLGIWLPLRSAVVLYPALLVLAGAGIWSATPQTPGGGVGALIAIAILGAGGLVAGARCRVSKRLPADLVESLPATTPPVFVKFAAGRKDFLHGDPPYEAPMQLDDHGMIRVRARGPWTVGILWFGVVPVYIGAGIYATTFPFLPWGHLVVATVGAALALKWGLGRIWTIHLTIDTRQEPPRAVADFRNHLLRTTARHEASEVRLAQEVITRWWGNTPLIGVGTVAYLDAVPVLLQFGAEAGEAVEFCGRLPESLQALVEESDTVRRMPFFGE